MTRTIIGLVVVALVAGVVILATQLDMSGKLHRASPREPVRVSLYYGGEKSAFLRNPEVLDLIERRYRVTLDATKAGSVEMVTTLDPAGKDCLWPSNAIAVELARSAGRKVRGTEAIFGSPIVFYAWTEVADALSKHHAVSVDGEGRLMADVAIMADLITRGARWQEDFGLNLYGPFRIFSTNPAKSNSGNIWSALLATAFNGGQPPTEADLVGVIPRIEAYFNAMGYMESSSGDIFENFLKQGMGARPIIVGYENQLVEFLLANAQYVDLIRDKIRVIYPAPTIFASHPLISLTDTCDRLAEALIDPDVQTLAWRDHGFRTGLVGVENDPRDVVVADLPETVPLVVPMPSGAVVQRIVDVVAGRR